MTFLPAHYYMASKVLLNKQGLNNFNDPGNNILGEPLWQNKNSLWADKTNDPSGIWCNNIPLFQARTCLRTVLVTAITLVLARSLPRP